MFLIVVGCGVLGVHRLLSLLSLQPLLLLLMMMMAWACSNHGCALVYPKLVILTPVRGYARNEKKQFVNENIVNLLLACYFAFIGAFALAATVDPILVQLLGTAVSAKGDTGLFHALGGGGGSHDGSGRIALPRRRATVAGNWGEEYLPRVVHARNWLRPSAHTSHG